MMSFSIALMKASRAASLPSGGVHVPLHLKRFASSHGLVEFVRLLLWKNSLSRKRLVPSVTTTAALPKKTHKEIIFHCFLEILASFKGVTYIKIDVKPAHSTRLRPGD